MVTKMMRAGALAAIAALPLAAPASAQGQCSRETLEDVAKRYVEAQRGGSIFALPVGEWVDYRENYAIVSSNIGVISQPAEFAWQVSLIDTGNCRVFVQGVILKPKPYVVGTRLAWSFNGLGQIDSVVTAPGDPQFDAAATAASAGQEDWGPIAADKRDTREALMAAANAWLATQGQLAGSEFTVDETIGAVAVRARAGGPEGKAVGYVLRIEGGKVRYAHTLATKG